MALAAATPLRGVTSADTYSSKCDPRVYCSRLNVTDDATGVDLPLVNILLSPLGPLHRPLNASCTRGHICRTTSCHPVAAPKMFQVVCATTASSTIRWLQQVCETCDFAYHLRCLLPSRIRHLSKYCGIIVARICTSIGSYGHEKYNKILNSEFKIY